MKCPICNKSGLLDKESVCPNCDTNLTGLWALEDIEVAVSAKENRLSILDHELLATKTNLRKFRFLSMGLMLGVAALLATVLFRSTSGSNIASVFPKKHEDLMLAKQLDSLRRENEALRTQPVRPVFRYRVRRGDSLYRIAAFFYNDGSKYSKIMKDNRLGEGEYIHPGDTLLIQPE